MTLEVLSWATGYQLRRLYSEWIQRCSVPWDNCCSVGVMQTTPNFTKKFISSSREPFTKSPNDDGLSEAGNVSWINKGCYLRSGIKLVLNQWAMVITTSSNSQQDDFVTDYIFFSLSSLSSKRWFTLVAKVTSNVVKHTHTKTVLSNSK